ncbi:MAG TPA: S9 family peptidase [Bryobacteraceae bacterium]|nr:S9 family peptidase [Bryobacteraceae bacterium]
MKSTLPLLFVAAAIVAAQPDPRIGAILGDLGSTQNFDQVVIAPDASRVAWVAANSEGGAIFVRDVAGGGVVKLGQGDEIAWSPDSQRIAFLSDREQRGQSQLYVASVKGWRAKRLTALKGYVTDPRWSPNGSKIAILFAEDAPTGGGPLGPEPAATGVIGGKIYNQRLTIVNASSGSVAQISPADLNIYEYDWSPDGSTFAATAAPGPGDNNWWVAKLYTMTADSGKMTEIYKPVLQIAMPRWSPDGSTIGFIEGLMSDEGFTGGDVFTMRPGSRAENRTPGRKSSVSSIAWTGPSKMLLTEFTGGSSAVTSFDTSTGQSERLWQGDQNLHAGGNYANFSVARDGRTAGAILADWQKPPEVWAGPIGEWKQITKENSDRHPQWGRRESVAWTNDGFNVQGWLLYPREFDASKKYPMIVSIHGGPANLNQPHWPGVNFDLTILSSLGYFVFFPNPRGSYGQGEAFTSANVKDFGYGDLRDVMAGVDTVLKTAPVDPQRLGVAGWSYGGYMTMWTVTQTQRFKAAVAGAGIANYQSYYGENSIDQWMIPYFGASVYDDPQIYARSSPITFIKNVKTPTLVVVGERDGECPAPQSFEFWHALETFHVPVELVVYAGEGHSFRQPDHRRDVLERTVEWFEQYLK